jgi:hypothetical protein
MEFARKFIMAIFRNQNYLTRHIINHILIGETNRDFHSPIFLATFFRIVWGNKISGAIPVGNDAIGSNFALG